MTQPSVPQLPVPKSIPPVRQILVVEPVQQHLGLHAVLLPPGTQCTIGSSRACTLTVRAQGILPQHCLIVSEANRTVLKEFGEHTWLNDRPLKSPTELMENDRIAIGPAEFRVRPARIEELESALPMDQFGAANNQQAAPQDLLRQKEELARTQHQLAAEAAKLQDREQGLRAREAELSDRFEELESKLKQLTAGDSDPASNAARELDARVQALIDGSSDFDEQRLEIERARVQFEQQQEALRQREEELQQRQALIANNEQQLEQKRQEFSQRETEINQFRQQFADQQATLETRRRELEARQQEVEKQRQLLEQMRSQLTQTGGNWGGARTSLSQATHRSGTFRTQTLTRPTRTTTQRV